MNGIVNKETWTCDLHGRTGHAGMAWLLTLCLLARRRRDAPTRQEPPARRRRSTGRSKPPRRPTRSRPSRSTASRCSTSATTSSRSTPNWFDTLRVNQAAVVRERVRRGPQHVRRRAAEPPRRQVVDADRTRRSQDHLRVRAVRHRRGRGTDHVPPAPRLGRARRGSGAGQYLEPVHRPGRVPELAGILGAHGSSVVPQRAAPLHARSRTTTAT